MFQKSGDRCAFPRCNDKLTLDENDNTVILSEVAHIVSAKPNGPRSDYPLHREQRDKYDNLILLCRKHHRLVDSQPQTYTVERLRQMKADHEKKVLEATDKILNNKEEKNQYIQETVYSTLLPVLKMPKYLYGVSCKYKDTEEQEAAKEISIPKDKNEMCPFIIRSGMIFCFQNLNYRGSPFRNIVGNQKVNQYIASDWWDDQDKMSWFVSLLNRSLNKLTGRKGLNLDKDHHRYYFMPKGVGKPLAVRYRPLNQQTTIRQVVWQPITKKTGKPKTYWYHRAIALKFHRVDHQNWCLCIRPEMHVTKDGFAPLESEKIGSKVTRKKARMYNYDLLGEIQFWRDFLGEGHPRIVLRFGKGQFIAVSTTIIQSEIEWPGMPEDHKKAFKNVEYLDDLFTQADWARLEEEYEEIDENGEEEDEL